MNLGFLRLWLLPPLTLCISPIIAELSFQNQGITLIKSSGSVKNETGTRSRPQYPPHRPRRGALLPSAGQALPPLPAAQRGRLVGRSNFHREKRWKFRSCVCFPVRKQEERLSPMRCGQFPSWPLGLKDARNGDMAKPHHQHQHNSLLGAKHSASLNPPQKIPPSLPAWESLQWQQ